MTENRTPQRPQWPGKISRAAFATQLDKIIGRLAGTNNPTESRIESAKKLRRIREQAVNDGK